MSEIRLNIRDTNDFIYGTIHGSVADAIVAALSAEPETIEELGAALQRFIKPIDDYRPFASFFAGSNEEPWDAGIVIVDLAARIVAVESSYSAPQPEGELQYHDGTKATDVSLFYRIPGDWLFVCSVDEYQTSRPRRCLQRANARPLDIRPVLYGAAMIQFIVSECAAIAVADPFDSGTKRLSFENTQSEDCDPQSETSIAAIHARWLMTPRAALRGQSPREVMLANLEFIDFDLHTREFQWSMLGEGPPPLARDSFAYRFAGFGSHEYVLYYELMRHLLRNCWQGVPTNQSMPLPDQLSHLSNVRDKWLNSPQRELDGRVPNAIIESERRRIPMAMSAKSMMIDENCEWCRMFAGDEEHSGPAFWHLDGCNMDEGFVFSFHRTLDDWEEEQRRFKEFNEEFDRKWAEEHSS